MYEMALLDKVSLLNINEPASDGVWVQNATCQLGKTVMTLARCYAADRWREALISSSRTNSSGVRLPSDLWVRRLL